MAATVRIANVRGAFIVIRPGRGDTILLVDDVVTTGGSSIEAVDRIEEFGCETVQVVGIIDRLQGAAANFDHRGLPFRTLLTVEDFGIKPSTG